MDGRVKPGHDEAKRSAAVRNRTHTTHPATAHLCLAVRSQAMQRRRNLIGQLAQPLHRSQNRGDISVRTETADDGGGSARRDRMPVQLIPGVNIRDMNLDFWSFEYLQGVVNE
jgi:hypothetical protein